MKNYKRFMMETFDILFVMVLCFMTLLSAMLMKGKSTQAFEYLLNPVSFFVTLTVLGSYFWYVVCESRKELRATIKICYERIHIGEDMEKPGGVVEN